MIITYPKYVKKIFGIEYKLNTYNMKKLKDKDNLLI